MSKARVPLFGQPRNFVNITPEATVGATIGVNLYNADGTLFDPSTLTGSSTTIVNGVGYIHDKRTGNAITINASDDKKIIELTFAGAITITVSGLIPFSRGFDFIVFCSGSGGQATFAGTNGMVISSPDSLKTRTLYSPVGLMVDDTNEATLYGDIEPVAPARSALIRSANSVGAPAFVAPTADGQVLKRSSGTLVFGALTATEVSSTATGSVSATNVQAAIAELEAEKQPLDTQLTTIAGLTLTGQAGKALKVNSGGTDFELGAVATDLTAITTDVKLTTIGNGLYITEGANATMGVATLVAGSKVVNTTKVTANSRIFTSIQSLGTVTVPKAIGVTARTAGTSFTLTSADATDTSVIAWHIVEPIIITSYATLNPSDKSSNVTLSGSDLIASSTVTSAGLARSVQTITGKKYFEAVFTNVDTPATAVISAGVCNTSLANTASGYNDANSWSYWGTNAGARNSGSLVISNSSAEGDVLGFAVDVTANKMWIRKNGTWLQGDPAAGTSPIWTNLTGTLHAYASPWDSNAVVTMRFDPSSFSNAAPSGFDPMTA